MNTAKVCQHLVEQPELETLFVLDSHVHLTDAFVKCRRCDAHYLVELADLQGSQALFRVSAMDAEAVQKTIHSLTRGSCDLNRARNEVFSLSSAARTLDGVLLMQNSEFTAYITPPGGLSLPNRSWRELPCDGSVFAQLAGSDHL